MTKMETAKKDFEKEREKTLGELPENLKEMFGQIGFAAQDGDDEDQMIPVLIVSPYDVPPKPVRDVYWFDLFSKSKRTRKLSAMPFLVYHYGSDDPDDCYSFLEHDEFVKYEVGCEKGYNVLPETIAQKISSGEELTEEQQVLVRGLEEMKEDLKKDPAERKRGVLFQERYESLKKEGDGGGEPTAKRQKKK